MCEQQHWQWLQQDSKPLLLSHFLLSPILIGLQHRGLPTHATHKSTETTVLSTLNSAVAGPLVWNSLPANIRSASISLHTLARKLNTYLFELPWAQLRKIYFALQKWTPCYYIQLNGSTNNGQNCSNSCEKFNAIAKLNGARVPVPLREICHCLWKR